MRFLSWFRDRTRTRQASRPLRAIGSRVALRLEQLECREVPAAVLINSAAAVEPPFPELTAVNGTLFYKANDGIHGVELWKSDGTAGGNMMVKDIYPGSRGSYPYNLTNVNGTVFFFADDAVHGYELWKSDGTPEGTMMVTPGAQGSQSLTNVNGTLFFTNGALWKSDGTPEGTVLVKDGAAFGSYPLNLTNVNGTLYLTAHGLWKSDGTPEGTVLVKDIVDFDDFNASDLTIVNGTLFFVANDGVSGRELWKSDGTPEGTVLVKDINPGSDGSRLGELTNVNGTLFFHTWDGGFGGALWKSDGTAEGTVVVKDNLLSGGWKTNVNGTLFFYAGPQLWKSDGTEAGTVLVTYFQEQPTWLTNVDGRLFFSGFQDLDQGRELWTSDGTVLGTFMVQDIAPSVRVSSSPAWLTVCNGSLFFPTNYGLWRLSQFVRDDAARTPTNTAVTINIVGNDFLGAGAAIASLTAPAHGSAVLNAGGTITYNPTSGFSGVDSFTYTVTNRFGDVDTATVTVRVIQPVQIDVKPGDRTNAINLNNDGTITVAVFSTATFDARTIDVASVLFAGASAFNWSLQDVNRDGKLDLVLQFRIDDTNLREMYQELLLVDAADGTLDTTRQQTSLLLSGSTTDGGLWEGLDAATLFESGKDLDDLLTALGLK